MSERGNALFLILIAVALFAALSYAITQSGRGGGGTIVTEQDYIYAAQITQLGADLKVGVQRMILNGTPSTSIVTNTPSNKGYAGAGPLNGTADFCTTGVTCLFAPEGGGVTVPQVPTNALLPTLTPALISTWHITSYSAGAGSFNGVEIDGLSPGYGPSDAPMPGVGTAAPDDLVRIFPLTSGVCKAINNGLGFGSVILIWTTIPSGTEQACLNPGSDGVTFYYYQVLVAN